MKTSRFSHAACVDLKGVRKAKDGLYGFPAHYPGTCATCGNRIHAGDRITAGGQIKIAGEALTIEGNRAENFGAAIIKQVKIQNPNVEATVKTLTENNSTDLGDALYKALAPRIEDRLAKLEARPQALTNTIVLHALTDTKVDVGLTHEAFESVLWWARLGCHVWLAGPAASGKTTIPAQVAKALDRKFVFDGARWDSYGLSGFMNATGAYVRTNFRDAFEHGYVYLLDEVDACEPAAMLWLNGALANGHASFPDGMVKCHENFVCICAGNTWGLGATSEYIGRLKQDAAFLDRFVKIAVNYDKKLERAIASNDAWVDRVFAVREKVAARGLKVLVTPRASIRGAKALANGMAWEKVEDTLLGGVMTPELWAEVK
jgi:MoxR-like ATPase